MAKPVTNPYRNGRGLFKRTAWVLLLLFAWQQAAAITVQQSALADCCPDVANTHQHHDDAMHTLSESSQSDYHNHYSRCDPSLCKHCIAGCQTVFSHTQLLPLLSIKQAAPVDYTYHFIPLSPLSTLYRPPILG
ncbi:MAG: hypothetical protein ACRBCI_10260 [Cellvibrionaceae bacterium]